jgi:hypothetical protein
MLKHVTDALVGLGGTFEVLVGTNLLADLLALCNSVSHMLYRDLSHTSTQPRPQVETWQRETSSCGFTYLLSGDRLLACLVQLFLSLGVVSEILLAANQDDRKALAEVQDF